MDFVWPILGTAIVVAGLLWWWFRRATPTPRPEPPTITTASGHRVCDASEARSMTIVSRWPGGTLVLDLRGKKLDDDGPWEIVKNELSELGPATGLRVWTVDASRLEALNARQFGTLFERLYRLSNGSNRRNSRSGDSMVIEGDGVSDDTVELMRGLAFKPYVIKRGDALPFLVVEMGPGKFVGGMKGGALKS